MASEPKSTTSKSAGFGLGELLVDPPMGDFPEGVPRICLDLAVLGFCPGFNLREHLELLELRALVNLDGHVIQLCAQ